MNRDKSTKLDRFFPWLLVVGGFIGILAAAILMIEKVEILKDPSFVPSCNINPILACGDVINTAQASAFGFPNPLIGIAGFAVVITVGMSLLAGAQMKKWYWLTFNVFAMLGVFFIHWLFFQSVYRIGALCPYCMVVWAVTIPIFWYLTVWNLRHNYLKLPKNLNVVERLIRQNHLGILIAWYLIITGLILYRFWYFFGP